MINYYKTKSNLFFTHDLKYKIGCVEENILLDSTFIQIFRYHIVKQKLFI